MRETGFEPVSPETVVLKTTGITELTDSRNRCFVILRSYSMFPRPVRHTNTCEMILNHFLCYSIV
jgi:hypothetical protein